MYKIGGARIQLQQGMEKKYIPYKFLTSLSRWKERWFYIENHEPSLPKRMLERSELLASGPWRART
jgi:hypothetical protein